MFRKIIFIVILLSSCSNQSQSNNVENNNIKREEILSALESNHITPRFTGESSSFALIDAPGVVYRLAGQIDKEVLYIHYYPDAKTAREKSTTIPPSGGNGLTDWIDTPHFFLCDNIILLYLGNDEITKTVFTDKCGPQFAGMQ